MQSAIGVGFGRRLTSSEVNATIVPAQYNPFFLNSGLRWCLASTIAYMLLMLPPASSGGLGYSPLHTGPAASPASPEPLPG